MLPNLADCRKITIYPSSGWHSDSMLDEKDSKILAELMKNGRRSVVDIAADLSLPRATVQERIRRMVGTGIIRKFVAVPDYSKIGKPVTAFILVSFLPGAVSQRELAEQVGGIPSIHEVHLIAGEWDIILKARAVSVDELSMLVVDRLRALRGVARTVTCVSFGEISEDL